VRWAGHVARMGERRDVYQYLVGKLEGMRLLWRPRRKWGIILKWGFRKWDVEVCRVRAGSV